MTLTILVPLITFPYISRIFLAEGSGRINFVSSVVQIFTLFASLGTGIYGTRTGALFIDDRERLSKLEHELLFINISSSAITYTVFLACVFFVPAFSSYKGLLLISGLTIGFTAINPDWVLGVYVDYTYITIRQIIIQIFTVAFLFLFIHKPDDIYLYVSISAFSNIIAVILTFAYCRKYVSFRPKSKYNYNIKQHLLPILILFATSLAAKVYSNIDTVLLGLMTGDSNVGMYSAAVKINTIIITFFAAMSPVFVPKIIELKEKKYIDEYILLLRKILGLVLGFGIPAVIGIEVLGDQIIYVLADRSFAPASLTMRLLAPIVILNACANVLYYDVLVPYGKENNVLFCTAIGAMINLIVSLVLIPLYHENGAAIGSVIAEIISLVAAAHFCNKVDRKFLEKLPCIRNYLIGGAVVAVWCLICINVIKQTLLQLFTSVIGGAALYIFILIVSKDFIGSEIIAQGKKIIQRIKSFKI